jgi:hypothetical protein
MLTAIALITGGAQSIINRLQYQGTAAAIESLRQDAAKVCVSQSEDVVGQVTLANQNIAKMRAYNNNPLLDVFIPDGWDRIEPIAIADPTSCTAR